MPPVEITRNKVLGRRALETLDLLLLATESLDISVSESILTSATNLGLDNKFTNRVEIWKLRSHNPLRKASRRGLLKTSESEALILILSNVVEKLYPIIHRILSTNEPQKLREERFSDFAERFRSLIAERMNTRRGAIQRLLDSKTSDIVFRQFLLILSLSVGTGGLDRLRSCLVNSI